MSDYTYTYFVYLHLLLAKIYLHENGDSKLQELYI